MAGTKADLKENFLKVDKGQTRDKVAKYGGVSGKTYENSVRRQMTE